MYDYLLIRILSFSLGFLFIISPIATLADEINSSSPELRPFEKVEAPIKMSDQQMNEIFGADPYLGQTSYLQFPDGFNQKDNSE